MPLIQTSASGSLAGSRNCLIIIKLKSQQDKTADEQMKIIRFFAMMLCIATLVMVTSCSKDNGKQDPIIGNWRIVDGTSYYTDSEGNLQDNGVDVGVGIGYREDGDYFVAGDLYGKWKRKNDNIILIQEIDSDDWYEERILSLTEEYLKIYRETGESKTTEILKRQ